MNKKIKAYFLLLVSGWHDIDVFGLPVIPKGSKFISVMITSGDGTLIDICQPFKYKKKTVWQQGGMSNEMYPEYRKVLLWKYIKKDQFWGHWFCKKLSCKKCVV